MKQPAISRVALGTLLALTAPSVAWSDDESIVRNPAVRRFGNPEFPTRRPRPFADHVFTLEQDDVVVFLGQTDFAQMRHDATLEALLAWRFTAQKPRFRNMAWEGDSVFEQWRDLNFGSVVEQLRAVGATVVFIQFGPAEIVQANRANALPGNAAKRAQRVSEVVDAYRRMLDNIAQVTPRIVIVGPRRFEKPSSRHMPDHRPLNGMIAELSVALADIAAQQRYLFVDLTDGERTLAGRLTSNGIHLTLAAQNRVAKTIARQLRVAAPRGLHWQPLHAAILEKNRLWFDNWRPMNWSFAFGDRVREKFGQAAGGRPPLRIELEEFKPLVAAADRRIHREAEALSGGRTVGVAAPPAANLAPIPSTRSARDVDHSAAAEQAAFRLADGFDVNLFASEADGVVKPLQMRWDDRGRLWVLCAPTYPHIEPGKLPRDYILVCEDTNRDGRADRFHRFARGLFMPQGIAFGDGGIYLCEGPELVHLKDTDDDGRADTRRVVLSGFGTADSHQMINNLVWGPGGALWFTQGHHTYSHVETPWGLSQLHKSGVWKYRPRTGKLEGYFNLSSAGLNCQGVAWDAWGQIFHNSAAGSGGFYTVAGMIPTERPLEFLSLAVPERRNTGIEFLGSQHLPPELNGCLIWGGYMSGTVQVHRLLDKGSGFTAQALPDLLTSARPEFRPVCVRNGPDGAIYVCDWYSAIIGHYQASYRDPARDRTRGRIWRITARDRPPVTPLDLSQLTPSGLLAQLESPEALSRYHARRRLFDLPSQAALSATDQWLATLDPTDREHERRLLAAAGIYEAHEEVRPALLAQLLSARDPRVRAYGARLIGAWSSRLDEPLSLLRRAVLDEHPRVRLEAVVAASHIPKAESIQVASMAIESPRDTYIDYAFAQCVHALKPHWLPALARGELRFGDQSRRLQAVLESDGTEDVRGWVRELCDNPTLGNAAQERLLALLVTVGDSGDLEFVLRKAGRSRPILDALVTAADVHGKRPSGDLRVPVSKLLDDSDPIFGPYAFRLAAAWQLSEFVVPARATLADPDAGEAMTLAALAVLARLDGRAALPLIERNATAERSAAIQAAAISAMAEVDLAAAAKSAAPLLAACRQQQLTLQLMEPFLRRKGGSALLAQALDGQAFDEESAKLAHRVLSRAGRMDANLLAVLNLAIGIRSHERDYDQQFVRQLAREAIATGDVHRGRQVYHSQLANCASCHRIAGVGASLGPDLTHVGAERSPELLIESLLWPNRQIREGYMSVRVLTDDGRLYTGYRLETTADELRLRDPASGDVERIAKAHITDIVDAGSIMPAGITAAMSREELRDLVRFLMALGTD